MNDNTIEESATFDKDICDLVTSTADIYVQVSLSFFNKMAVTVLVVVILGAAYESITNHTLLNLDYITRKFIVPYMFSFYILTYWITPIPGLGISFIGMFTNTDQ